MNCDIVGEAGNGKEAVSLFSTLKPNMLLLDINMPDMDGITATEKIRARLPATQIVILSVQSDSNYMRKAMLAGARDFLTKPPDLDELTDAIRRAGEMAHQEIGMELLKRVEADLAELGSVEQFPKMEGRQLTMVIAPRKKS